MSLKEEAIKLRKAGYSYSDISLKTGLSKGTLSYHLARIPYVPNKAMIDKVGKARTAAYATKHERKQNSFKSALEKAQNEIGQISDRDIFMLGIGVYIGEGSKTRDMVRLVNADPAVLRIFVRWLMAMGLAKDNFAVRVHLYPETDVQKAELYWLNELNLPRACIQKACIDKRVGKSFARQGSNPFGTAHVTVRANGNKQFGVVLARTIGAYMKLVLELPGPK